MVPELTARARSLWMTSHPEERSDRCLQTSLVAPLATMNAHKIPRRFAPRNDKVARPSHFDTRMPSRPHASRGRAS